MPRRSIPLPTAEGPEPELKYKLTELLSRYSPTRRKAVREQLCEEVGISAVTWSKWANLRKNDTHDLPYLTVVHLAKRFGVQPESLCNIQVKAEAIQFDDLFGAPQEGKAA